MYSSGVDSREKLVEAMAELMWERGYSATSPRAVRELSGVGQGSMYHYFPTKRDLGLAALNHNCQIQLDSWKAALKDLEDPLEILTAYLTLPRDPLKGCRVGRMAQDKAVVADDGLRQPVPADLEPDHLARTMVAVVQGGYVLAMAEQDRAPYDAACQGALELLRVAAGTTGAAPGGDGSASS